MEDHTNHGGSKVDGISRETVITREKQKHNHSSYLAMSHSTAPRSSPGSQDGVLGWVVLLVVFSRRRRESSETHDDEGYPVGYPLGPLASEEAKTATGNQTM